MIRRQSTLGKQDLSGLDPDLSGFQMFPDFEWSDLRSPLSGSLLYSFVRTYFGFQNMAFVAFWHFGILQSILQDLPTGQKLVGPQNPCGLQIPNRLLWIFNLAKNNNLTFFGLSVQTFYSFCGNTVGVGCYFGFTISKLD